jgi:hypothetical protein
LSFASLRSLVDSGSHGSHLCLAFRFLRFLHRLPRISILLHSLFAKRAVPSPVICISKKWQLDYGRKSIKDPFDWYGMALRNFGKGEEILTRLSNIDDSTRTNTLTKVQNQKTCTYIQIRTVLATSTSTWNLKCVGIRCRDVRCTARRIRSLRARIVFEIPATMVLKLHQIGLLLRSTDIQLRLKCRAASCVRTGRTRLQLRGQSRCLGRLHLLGYWPCWNFVE